MASLVRRPNGRREIQFTDSVGKRHTVRLGKMPKRDAESVKTRVEHLLTAQITKRPIEGDTARWVASLDDVLAARLARVGLIRARESAMLGDFLSSYIKSRTDVKPLTEKKYRTTEGLLVQQFGASRLLRDIRPGDADDWCRELRQSRSENTVRKHIAVAKVFFTAALRKGLIDANPFADQSATIQANPERFHFVTRDDADKVLAACPDAEWRLIFALSRYGGLRCPSEHLALTWDCIDWGQDRIRIKSPKTEHHACGASRSIPIFPELRPHPDAAFELAEEGGSAYVITRYRDTNTNLRTQLMRIIERAGLEPWPKLFQNLRSTRETELAEQFPMHVVCSWIGNTKAVATKHYLQVTDEHFRKATQNPTQTVQDKDDCDGQQRPDNEEKSENSGAVTSSPLVFTCSVAEAGLEPARPSRDTGF